MCCAAAAGGATGAQRRGHDAGRHRLPLPRPAAATRQPSRCAASTHTARATARTGRPPRCLGMKLRPHSLPQGNTAAGPASLAATRGRRSPTPSRSGAAPPQRTASACLPRRSGGRRGHRRARRKSAVPAAVRAWPAHQARTAVRVHKCTSRSRVPARGRLGRAVERRHPTPTQARAVQWLGKVRARSAAWRPACSADAADASSRTERLSIS